MSSLCVQRLSILTFTVLLFTAWAGSVSAASTVTIGGKSVELPDDIAEEHQKLIDNIGIYDDPELDAVVGRMVEMEFLNTAQGQSDERSEHLQTIGEILSLVPSERRDAVVDFLKAEHEETLVHIQKSLFTIDAIPSILPRAAVPVVFREIDMDQTIRLIASLQGAHSEIADFLLSNISSRMADMIRDELGGLGTLSEEEAEDTQRMFIGKLMELKRLGKIETMKEAA